MKFRFLIVCFSFAFSILNAQISAYKVQSKPAIDGNLNESFWSINTPLLIIDGSTENTAFFGVLWDDDYLYVGVNVTDTAISLNGSQGWHDDGVEVCIDPDYSHNTVFDTNDRQFLKAVKTYWLQEMNKKTDGVIAKYKKTTNGYSMEFAIPWTNFNTVPVAGNTIGFNVVVNDDDFSSTSYNTPASMRWTGNSTYYQNTSSWGALTLSSQTIDYTGDFIALLNPFDGDFLINGNDYVIDWVSKNVTSIKIEYSTDNGTQWQSIINSVPAVNGSYTWNVSATPSTQCKIRISDAANASLNDQNEDVLTISSAFSHVTPLIKNLYENFTWPLNAYYPIDNPGINGHFGNACGHSSLVRIIHTWQFPVIGNNQLTFTDNVGSVWSANFGATIYNYDNMPNYISPSATVSEYNDAATLFYHAAVSMHDIYGSGTDFNNMSYAMSHYFRYKVSTPAERRNYTKAQWISLLKNELDSGRVLLVSGITPDPMTWHSGWNVAGHWFHCDGYNEEGKFHIVVGFGNFTADGFYDVDSFPGYFCNNGVLLGLEPELNGKILKLTSHNTDSVFIAGAPSNITWSSTNVSAIKIEFTQDNGQNWTVVANNVPTSTGLYAWTAPMISSTNCRIKLTDVSDMNVYDKSNELFKIFPYHLNLLKPDNNIYVVKGSKILIEWEASPVQNINIEYSTSNGTNWVGIATNIPTTSLSYLWTTPSTFSSLYKVRITDASNPLVYSENTGNFEVGDENVVGGPYAIDSNTIVLLHFDGDLINQSALTADASGPNFTYDQNSISQMGKCLNPEQKIQIPHDTDLNLNGNWTLEAWIKMYSYFTSYYTYLINKPADGYDPYLSNYALQVNPFWSNVFYGYYFSGATRYGVTSYAPNLNQWYHVAFIRDTTTSTLKLIVRDSNRQIVSQSTQPYSPGPALFSNQNLSIGSDLDGLIDEVRISNIVRPFTIITNTEVATDELQIFPNPSSSMIYINISERIESVTLYDITSKIVISGKSSELNVEGVRDGIYFMKIETPKNIYFRKVVIN